MIRLARPTLLAAAALSALAFTVAAPRPAEARRRVVVDRVQIKGDTLVANWFIEEGNFLTQVNVVATSQKTRTRADAPQHEDFASISISRAEIDTGNVLVTGSAYTEQFDLDVNGNQSRGRFRADAIFQDDNSFTFFDLHVDLTFDGVGPLSTQRDRAIDTDTPGLIVKTRFTGKFRDAIATGSVYGTRRADSPTAWAGLPFQFTPVPSDDGQIQKNKFGTVTIQVGTP